MAFNKSEERDTKILGVQVTDKEIREMHEIFGEDVIPNREMYPSSFEYYYKVYRVFKYDKACSGCHMYVTRFTCVLTYNFRSFMRFCIPYTSIHTFFDPMSMFMRVRTLCRTSIADASPLLSTADATWIK